FPQLPAELESLEENKGIIELNAVVVKACKPEARQRYQSAYQMHQDLLLLVAGRSVRRTHAMERRLKLMTRLGTVSAAVIVLGADPYYLAIKEGRSARASAKKDNEQRQRADEMAQQAEGARHQAEGAASNA